MSKEEVKATLGNVLLAFQVCLALWQILKLTPLGAVVKGVMGWLLRPLGLSPTYTRLKCLPGRVFKSVHFFSVLESGQRQAGLLQHHDEMTLCYLGKPFHLERRRTGAYKNKLFVNEKMCYYITQAIWDELSKMAAHLGHAQAAANPGLAQAQIPNEAQIPNAVFIKSYKEIWEHVATGRDMTFEEVLDCFILDNQIIKRSEGCSVLLPVDLSVSEEKLLKVLNLAGLFLQTKKVYWLIPVLLSLISTVMEFCTPLRIWIYGKVNLLFCYAMHLICDRLPRSMRMHTYALGKMVENLKPSNDIKLKVTRGNITAIIAAGAKVHTEGALTLVPLFVLEEAANQITLHCRPIDCDPIDIECTFIPPRVCIIRATTFDEISVSCNSRFDFLSILTLVSSIAKNGCGSLKSYGTHQNVRVRGLEHSIYSYGSSGCPNVYEMKLENVVVN